MDGAINQFSTLLVPSETSKLFAIAQEAFDAADVKEVKQIEVLPA